MFITLPPNFGAGLLRKRAKPMPPRRRKGLMEWLFGGGGMSAEEREQHYLRVLDRTEQEIEQAIAAGDADALNQLDWEIRDASPWDLAPGVQSPEVEARVDELLRRIEEAQRALGVEDPYG